VTEARFGVLTNGILYRFFTDLEQPNKMDEKPFFEFNIIDFKERDVEELKKFAKVSFDVETILTTANELKYTRVIQSRISEWIANPTEEFVRLASAELLGARRFTPQVRDQFTAITKRAFEQLIGERINERLKGAMAPEGLSLSEKPPVNANPGALEIARSVSSGESQVVTTPEEWEGFHIVRAILRGVVAPKRIFMRDAQSYCAVLLDDNNRKPICRLRFNNNLKLKFGVFNEKREEVIAELEAVDDIFNYSEQLKATVNLHVGEVSD
jgi:hypothetical protein